MPDQKPGRRVSTKAERVARKVIQDAEAAKAMADHEAAQRAKYQNLQRLKALRLEQERQKDQ